MPANTTSSRAARSCSRNASATESDPPDTAATTRVSGVHSECRAAKRRRREIRSLLKDCSLQLVPEGGLEPPTLRL